jgi:uncharacterized membrane protein YgdD (TMEM256/DUF423 family)
MSFATQFMTRVTFVFACFTAGASVLIAAYSAHVTGLEESSLRSVNSAIQMMQFHALALLVVSWINQAAKDNWFLIVSILFFVSGIALFSFNIVLHQLASISTFRPLIPFGGIAFVLGWVALAIAGFLQR